jgi:hypothetical protein
LNYEEFDAITQNNKYTLEEGIKEILHEVELLRVKNRVLALEKERAENANIKYYVD